MAVINYTKTKLDRGYTLISWESITDADTTQPFNLIGFHIESVQSFCTGGILEAYGRLSNEDTPVHSPQNNSWDLVGENRIVFNPFTFVCRWIWWEPIPSSVATLNIFMLVKDA